MALKVGNGLDLSNHRIQNLADPSSDTDAANKQYVDAFVRGLAWKDSVRAASTTNVPLSSPGASIDGVNLNSGDRVLLKDQTNGAQNGVYVWTGSASTLTRAVDADSAAELAGATVTVTEGTVNADRVYRLITDDFALDTDPLSWTQLGGAGTTYTAGDGLGESPAGTFNVGAGSGITVDANSVSLASSTAGSGLTYTTGVLAVGAGTGITVAADNVSLASTVAGNGLTHSSGVLAVGTSAGSGITVSADAISIDTSIVPRKYSTSIGNGSSTSIVVNHALNTRDVVVSVYDNSTFAEVITDVVHTDANNVTLSFGTAPTASQYKVVVIG